MPLALKYFIFSEIFSNDIPNLLFGNHVCSMKTAHVCSCCLKRNVTKFNVVISVISVFKSFILVSFLAVSGDISAINSLYAVAFQLFWMLPVWLVSFFAI